MKVAIKAFQQSIIEKKKLSNLIDSEIRVLKHLSNQGIIKYYESFEYHNHRFIVMELIEGKTLTQLLKSKEGVPLDTNFIKDIAFMLGKLLLNVH
jgi:serine/threonine protein kinase